MSFGENDVEWSSNGVTMMPVYRHARGTGTTVKWSSPSSASMGVNTDGDGAGTIDEI
jgi:hypothetical protein